MMSQRGNPGFIKVNKVALGNRGGGRKKAEIARLLEQFTPDVVAVVKEMLTAADPQMRWTCAKEILPYIWGKKSTVAVTAEGEPVTLSEYLAAKQSETVQPSITIPPTSPEPAT